MTNVVVNDWELRVDGADGEVGAVVTFVADAFRLWGCHVRVFDGGAVVDLPLPGDPVREFVMVGLRALADAHPDRVDFTETVGGGRL